jgi:hypothetical protein
VKEFKYTALDIPVVLFNDRITDVFAVKAETNICVVKTRKCARKILRCIASGVESAKGGIAVLEHIK